MAKLRIALMLPGEASLGAFEAGAVSALLVGISAHNKKAESDEVVVDVISGASSGALTAVVAARMLLSGQDPVAPLRRAWVQEPSIKALRGRGSAAPLSLDRARQVAYDILTATPPAPGHAQVEPVSLTFALSCLRGFTYNTTGRDYRQEHEEGAKERPIQATSYVDWARVNLGAGDSQGFTALWQYAVDAAIASASHPLAFPSVLLDRTAYRSEYVDREITNLPGGDELELWYADGGMLDRQPLGRCLDLVAEKEKKTEGGKRMVVLVRTDCDSAPEGSDPAWTGAADAPDWGETLTRTLRLVTTHSLFEDLRRAGKINDQIERTDALAETLAAAVSANRENVLEALGASPDDQLEELLKQKLRAAAGLEHKADVDISEVVGRSGDVAGASLARFGGFFAERTRGHDFLLGYRNMLIWMWNNLERGGVDRFPAMSAARARATTIPGWIGGRGTPVSPGLRGRAQVLGVGARVLRTGLSKRAGPR